MNASIIRLYLATKAKKALCYIPFTAWLTSVVTFVPLLLIVGWPSLLLFPSILSLGYLVFKDTMNKVQAVGRVYWIIRDNATPGTPAVSRGFMHEIDPPWRHGKGLQIRVLRWNIQVGVCKSHDYDEESGILAAVQGRFLDVTPIDIGKW